MRTREITILRMAKRVLIQTHKNPRDSKLPNKEIDQAMQLQLRMDRWGLPRMTHTTTTSPTTEDVSPRTGTGTRAGIGTRIKTETNRVRVTDITPTQTTAGTETTAPKTGTRTNTEKETGMAVAGTKTTNSDQNK